MILAHAGVIGQAGAGGFAYSDIPNQLLRVNSLEGSLAFSGAVLTGVTDVSGAGQTVTVTGSPVYTASDSGLNGAPSFNQSGGSSVVAPNVNRASVRFVAVVCYRVGTAATYIWDGDDAGNRHLGRFEFGLFYVGSTSNSVSGEPVAGRKRILAPNDGSTQVLFNGSTLTTAPAVGTASGNGLALGAAFNATFAGSRIAFFLACSSVPDSTARTALEAKLLEDFG